MTLSTKLKAIDSDSAILLVMGLTFFLIGFTYFYDFKIHSINTLSTDVDIPAPYLGILPIAFLVIWLSFFAFFVISWLKKPSEK